MNRILKSLFGLFIHFTKGARIDAALQKGGRIAVKATGKKTLIISGMWTSVIVVYPALSALGEGYTVYAVADASGDITPEAHNLAMRRMTRAGATPITVGAMLPELMKSWKRKEAGDFAKILAELVPKFQAVIEQYYKTQEVIKSQK